MMTSPQKQRLIIPVIGPSGVGKSTLIGLVSSQFPSCSFHDLDRESGTYAFKARMIPRDNVHLLVEPTWRRLFDVGQLAIRQIEAGTTKHLVIDIGAGFMQDDRAVLFAANHPAICIYSTPEVAYDRCRARSPSRRTLEGYKRDEFSPRHIKIHATCKRTIDISGLSIEHSAELFSESL